MQLKRSSDYKKILLEHGLIKCIVLHHASRQILQFVCVCVCTLKLALLYFSKCIYIKFEKYNVLKRNILKY